MRDRLYDATKIDNLSHMKKKILVIGSSNMDMVAQVKCFPHPGETILGGKFLMNQGGKGANQAVTVSRLSGDTDFICKIGNDSIGKQMSDLFIAEGIKPEGILKDDKYPSGVAIIMVDESAENSIVVASGANANLLPADINQLKDVVKAADYILMQLEIPMSTIEYVTSIASEWGKKVILNPAPMADLSDSLLEKLYAITPNKIEAETLTGIKIEDEESLSMVGKAIYNKGVKNVIITLGAEGAFVYNGEGSVVPAVEATPVDTTGAGDVFNGALTVALSEGKDLLSAVRFANKASSISITREGAILSVPYRKELSNI